MRRAGRISRWLAHPIGSVIVGCVLCTLLADAAMNARMTGSLSRVPLVGVALVGLLLLLLVYRVGQALAARASQAALQHAVQLGLLLALNFLLLALVFAAIGAAVAVVWPATRADRAFALLMTLSLRAGAWLGGVGGVIATAGVLVLGACRLARGVPGVAAVGRVGTRVLWSLTIVYAVGMTALTFGVARRWLGSPSTEVVATVRSVAPLFGPLGLVSVDVDSWRRPGDQERLLLIRGADDVAVLHVAPGHRLRIDVRPGAFGVPAVDRVRVDVDGSLPELVAAVPSAEWPRKWLMADLTRRARWPELVEQAREYHRYHPADRTTIGGVVSALRQGGQSEAARSLEAELGTRDRQAGRAL